MGDQIYNAYYGKLGEKRMEYSKSRIDWIIEQAVGDKVLDIGCSQGVCSLLLGGRGFHVLGIDCDDESIQFAQEKLSHFQELPPIRVQFICEDFMQTDFGEERYDTVIMTQVLEHLDFPEPFVEKAAALLAPNGRLILTVPFGINEAAGHKRTYYLGELYQCAARYLNVQKVMLHGHWIGIVCGLEPGEAPIGPDLQMVQLIETGFLGIERELRDDIKARKDRIAFLKEQNQKLRDKAAALKSTQAICQDLSAGKAKLEQEVRDKSEQIRLLEERCKRLQDEITAHTAQLEASIADSEELKRKLAAANQEAEELKSRNGELEQEGQDKSEQMRLLEEQAEELKTQKRDYLHKLKEARRKIGAVKESYNELANSKLGRLQLSYWHSPHWLARFARFIYRGLKNLFWGRKVDMANSLAPPVQAEGVPQPVNGTDIQRPSDRNGSVRKQKAVSQYEKIAGSKHAILFMATNGSGLGHLTRSLAIARRIARQRPEQEVIFLTTSIALGVVHREGFAAYHIPPKDSLPAEMTTKQWGSLLTESLNSIFGLYDVQAVVFDGAYPYAQFVRSICAQSRLEKIWVKRGGEKADKVEIRREQEKYFDHIILPGEAGGAAAAEDERHIAVDPIIYIDRDELLSREQVRSLFKVPQDKLFVYVQLGAGNRNDIQFQLARVIEALRKVGNVVIALGESLIGDDLQLYEDDIVVIKDYPNSKYFNGFDFAVSACGYNTFHELMYFGIPSLLIPNLETGTDDQLARGMLGVNAGLAVVVTELEGNQLEQAVVRLADAEENLKMRECAKAIQFENGADAAAKSILQLSTEEKGA